MGRSVQGGLLGGGDICSEAYMVSAKALRQV